MTRSEGKHPASGFIPTGGFLLLISLFLACGSSPVSSEVGGGNDSVVAAAPKYDPATANLMLLQASSIRRILSTNFALVPRHEFQGFSQAVEFRLSLHNPLAQTIELIAPEGGFRFEFITRKRRWRWDGAGEMVSVKAQTIFPEPFRIPPGDTIGEEWKFNLELGGSGTAIWELELGLLVHLSGVRIGERVLPISSLRFTSARILAFPPGWQALSTDPLKALRQAVVLPQPEADRQVLVAAALAAAEQPEQCMELLVGSLDGAPNIERLRSIKAALEFVSGERHQNRKSWQEWWRQRQNSHSD